MQEKPGASLLPSTPYLQGLGRDFACPALLPSPSCYLSMLPLGRSKATTLDSGACVRGRGGDVPHPHCSLTHPTQLLFLLSAHLLYYHHVSLLGSANSAATFSPGPAEGPSVGMKKAANICLKSPSLKSSFYLLSSRTRGFNGGWRNFIGGKLWPWYFQGILVALRPLLFKAGIEGHCKFSQLGLLWSLISFYDNVKCKHSSPPAHSWFKGCIPLLACTILNLVCLLNKW